MLIRTFVLKVTMEKKLTHHEIIGRIAEQNVKIIKIMDSSELSSVTFIIYLFI